VLIALGLHLDAVGLPADGLLRLDPEQLEVNDTVTAYQRRAADAGAGKADVGALAHRRGDHGPSHCSRAPLKHPTERAGIRVSVSRRDDSTDRDRATVVEVAATSNTVRSDLYIAAYSWGISGQSWRTHGMAAMA
jgi:hypothetical protein